MGFVAIEKGEGRACKALPRGVASVDKGGKVSINPVDAETARLGKHVEVLVDNKAKILRFAGTGPSGYAVHRPKSNKYAVSVQATRAVKALGFSVDGAAGRYRAYADSSGINVDMSRLL